jgi:hypothetical protein
VPVDAPASALIAWRRVHPVSSHSSSSIAPLSFFEAFAYRLAICLVTASAPPSKAPPTAPFAEPGPGSKGHGLEDILR